jgi:hypothetical protein
MVLAKAVCLNLIVVTLAGIAWAAAAEGPAAGVPASTELELHHPDFHARLGMKAFAVVGEAGAGGQLRATLDGQVVFEKRGGLQAEEVVRLNLRELPKGSHTLRLELLEGGNVVRSATRQFEKPYEGLPRVGIDENNSLCVQGRLFFPVTPWCVGDTEEALQEWAGCINTLNGYTFSDAEGTIEGWKKALDLAQKHGKMVIGPAYGKYWPNGSCRRFYTKDGNRMKEREANLDAMAEYVRQTRDHPALLMWGWLDEPELDTPSDCVTPAEVRRWTLKCHELDPHHPVYLNTGGSGFVRPDGSWLYNHIRAYTYAFGTADPSRKALVTDLLSQDYYPINGKGSSRGGTPITIENMCLAMDRMGAWNHHLAPLMAWVETCQIGGGNPAPTPAELRLLCWANVIHGAKGISWFHYFQPTPDENLKEMGRFLEQVTRLAPAVLGPEYAGTVGEKEEGGGRVDSMAREHEGAVYVFAANVKEAPQKVTFTLDFTPKSIEVVDEGRVLEGAGASFADAFEPLAVHIYRIAR